MHREKVINNFKMHELHKSFKVDWVWRHLPPFYEENQSQTGHIDPSFLVTELRHRTCLEHSQDYIAKERHSEESNQLPNSPSSHLCPGKG